LTGRGIEVFIGIARDDFASADDDLIVVGICSLIKVLWLCRGKQEWLGGEFFSTDVRIPG
jgi:hypothetical protein